MQTSSARRVVSVVDRTWENTYPTFSSSLVRHSYLSKRLHVIPYTCGLSESKMTFKDLGNNLFQLDFDGEGDYKFVIKGGTWHHHHDDIYPDMQE